MNRQIVLWGGTGQAKVLWELFERTHDHVVAIFENNREVRELSPQKPVPIYYGESGFLDWASTARPDQNEVYGLAAIGGSRGEDRVAIQAFMEAHHVRPIAAVHWTAFVASDAEIGASCQILAHATVCAEARLGAACIVNSSALVEHECSLGMGVHIGPGAKLAGLVQVDSYSFVGTGAIILPRIKIGRSVVIGAGAVVTKDVGDNMTMIGNPAVPYAPKGAAPARSTP